MSLSSWRMSLWEKGRVLDRSDYAELALIHSSCIDLGFLSSLGHGFLSLLYEAIDADDNSHLILEKKEGSVIGFVAGGRGMKSIYWKLLIRLPRLLVALFPALLNPRKLSKIIELLCFAKKQKPVSSSPEAELFSIAVIDSARGSGLAQKLYNALGERFFRDGESAFCMVVGENLSQAHRFYNKMGAVPFAQVSVHKGQSSTLYRQDLPIA
jgi:ribosomal protein S18 acetylase RimI-like enzyme